MRPQEGIARMTDYSAIKTKLLDQQQKLSNRLKATQATEGHEVVALASGAGASSTPTRSIGPARRFSRIPSGRISPIGTPNSAPTTKLRNAC